MNVLMVGVGRKRVGGMWSVAQIYLQSQRFQQRVKLRYVATSTNGSAVLRLLCMFWGYLKILCLLNFTKVDLVHIHMAEKGSTFRKGKVAQWAKKKGKRVILHLHAGPFISWYQTIDAKKQKQVAEIFSYADQVLVLGEYWKKELEQIIPAEKMTVLYNGVPCAKENPYAQTASNISYFGVMNKAKGIYDLLQAAKLLNGKLPPEVKFLLCGNDLEGDMAKKIEEYGLQDRVELLGWIDGEQKRSVYEKTMISVLPSYFEGLSISVLEACARGIPVVTTRISTMPEVLGEEGFMVETGDVEALAECLLRLSMDLDLRKKESGRLYERAKTLFSEDVFLDNTLAVYESLVGDNE